MRKIHIGLLFGFLAAAPISMTGLTPALAKQPVCKEKIRQYCFEMQREDEPGACIDKLEEAYLPVCEGLKDDREKFLHDLEEWCRNGGDCRSDPR